MMNALSTLSTLAFELPNIAIGLLVVLFLFISVVMILIVLIQKPQGGGLSGAFGSSSDGAGQTAFGAKTGDVLTTATIVVFLVFLTTAVVLNYAVRPSERSDEVTVASDDTFPVEESAPTGAVPDDLRVVPVPPPTTQTQTPEQTDHPTDDHLPIRMTNEDGTPGPEIKPVSPEELEYLLRGELPPGATPLPGQGTKPAETKPEETDPPAEETPANGGN